MMQNRRRLPFRSVNRRDDPGFDPALQRHHLLPRQLRCCGCFQSFFGAIGVEQIGFDDFRLNGLLLPANDTAVLRTSLPLHRGPHRDYSAMVMDRVGQIEAAWSHQNARLPEIAIVEALAQLQQLQGALRRNLLVPVRQRIMLNRRDPLVQSADYSDLDAMAEELWGETGSAIGR
jgi:hypothetical protein